MLDLPDRGRWQPTLNIWQVQHPASVARTAFIEALVRAGVKVSAEVKGANPAKLLPKGDGYAEDHKVAEHVSPPLSEFVKVILKVSYNRGADLMLCLAAVKAGSRTARTASPAPSSCSIAWVSPRTAPTFSMGPGRTITAILAGRRGGLSCQITGEPWGAAVRNGMAVLGVDGTQATNGVGTPAAGHIQIKDGTRVSLMPGETSGIIIAKTQVGYIEAKSGRQLVYGIFLNNAP